MCTYMDNTPFSFPLSSSLVGKRTVHGVGKRTVHGVGKRTVHGVGKRTVHGVGKRTVHGVGKRTVHGVGKRTIHGVGKRTVHGVNYRTNENRYGQLTFKVLLRRLTTILCIVWKTSLTVWPMIFVLYRPRDMCRGVPIIPTIHNSDDP